MDSNQDTDFVRNELDDSQEWSAAEQSGFHKFWYEIKALPLKEKILFHYGWIGFILSFIVSFYISPLNFLSSDDMYPQYPSVPSFGVDHAGEHCANDQIIINYGVADCGTATKIVKRYDFHQAATVLIDGFTCAPPQDISSDHFFDVWCTRLYQNAITSFFASATPGFYAHFPLGFSHWLPDVSAYARIDHPGIDFRTEGNTIQCIVLGDAQARLECAGEKLPGHSHLDPNMPNNQVIFTGKKKPELSFGQSAEFSYGQRRVLSDGNTIFYKNFICSATVTQMHCANISTEQHGFTVSPTAFNSY